MSSLVPQDCCAAGNHYNFYWSLLIQVNGKPANILFHNGVVKIVDIGISLRTLIYKMIDGYLWITMKIITSFCISAKVKPTLPILHFGSCIILIYSLCLLKPSLLFSLSKCCCLLAFICIFSEVHLFFSRWTLRFY